jgi:elongation factor Ts
VAEGKSEAVAAKIVDGRMNKWYEEIVLMEQPWFFDDSKKVSEVLTDLIAEIKENIVVRRFARFELGEGSADGAGA